MEYRKFGKTDMKVSVLGFGGAEIGFEGVTQEDVTTLLNSAIDAGLNVIDSAAAYLVSEQLIGNAIAGRRKDFYLFTKCGAVDGFTRADWSKAGILDHIGQSLKSLQTDYLDLIQLHSPSTEVLKKGEAIEALQEAKERGLVRYIGYSGDGEDALFAIETGVFDTLQTSVSIADQQSIELLLPKAQELELGVIAKRPVANAAWRTGEKPKNAYHHAYWDRLVELDYDFLKLPLSEAVAIALRFTLSHPVHTAIVGTTNPGRWQENAKSLEAGALSQDEINKIRSRWQAVADSSWVGQV
jgi:aryl-alcohol dehydrogenase-like predicted oxidoreductase